MWGRPCCQGHPYPLLQLLSAPRHLGGGATLTNPTGLAQGWLPPQRLSRGGQPEESYLFTLIQTSLLGGGWLLSPSLPC